MSTASVCQKRKRTDASSSVSVSASSSRSSDTMCHASKGTAGKDKLRSYIVEHFGTFVTPKITATKWWSSDDALLSNNEYPHQMLHFALKVLLTHASLDKVAHLYPFIEDIIDSYEDTKYYAYRSCLALLAKAAEPERACDRTFLCRLVDRVVFLLLHTGPPPKSAEEYQGFLCIQSSCSGPALSSSRLCEPKILLSAFSELWLCVLKNLPDSQPALLHSILADLPLKVLPYLTQPTRLMDFLTDAYDTGGLTSLLALQSLFHLIHHYNLDYPDFYGKLYSLLDPQLLHVKHRFRFFRLLDLFLASSHLPAYLMAAFIKRLSRLALYAPPSSLLWLIPFIYNLLKRVPATRVLIHRADPQRVPLPVMRAAEPTDTSTDGAAGPAFDFATLEPAASHALGSSLWELAQLRFHAYPRIASFAKVFGERLTKPEYELRMKPNALSYHSMIEAHIQNARIGKGPTEHWALSAISKAPFLA